MFRIFRALKNYFMTLRVPESLEFCFENLCINRGSNQCTGLYIDSVTCVH